MLFLKTPYLMQEEVRCFLCDFSFKDAVFVFRKE